MARLAENAGLRIASRPIDVVAEADVILVVTPPGAAVYVPPRSQRCRE